MFEFVRHAIRVCFPETEFRLPPPPWRKGLASCCLVDGEGGPLRGADGRPFEPGVPLDCIWLDIGCGAPPLLERALALLLPCLGTHGMVAAARNPEGGCPAGPLLECSGLMPYAARAPREDSRYTMIEIHRHWRDPLDGAGQVFCRPGYDPLSHARALAQEDRPEAAFHVLDHIPPHRLEDPVYRLQIAQEQQLALLAMPPGAHPSDPVKRFYWGQYLYYAIQNLAPRQPASHICQAYSWARIGQPAQGGALLRTAQRATGDPSLTSHVSRFPEKVAPWPPEPAPPPCPETFRPRLLLINHGNLDVGFDALFDGLYLHLGASNVVEYPWKYFLHGEPFEGGMHHPSQSDHPGGAIPVEELVRQLSEGAFDAVVYSDVFSLQPREEVLRLVHANPDIPLVLLDTQDEGWNNAPRMLGHIERESAAAHFKREMLYGVDYGPNAFPMPLCYLSRLAPAEFQGDRPDPVFWAGHRHFGQRRLMLGHIEAKLGQPFEQTVPPGEFRARLAAARVGIDIHGLGYDTVRYSELPCHGCMLLAQRKPIRIPHDYEEGVSAVFFDDLEGLEAKLDYYMARPAEAEIIARAGHAHAHAHHTSRARAAHFLGYLHQALAPRP